MRIRLMIEGLSAFLPQPAITPGTMRILIPDVRQSVDRRDQDDVIIHVCRHEPRLIFSNGTTWDLEGEHIEISDGTGGLTIDQSFEDRMSDMRKIAAGSEVVHPGFLSQPPQN